MNLGNTIKVCREKRGYKQGEFADLAGISVSHLCLLEKNKRDPSLSTAESIANALRIPLSVLVFLAAEKGELKELSESQIEELSRSVLGLMDDVSRQESLF